MLHAGLRPHREEEAPSGRRGYAQGMPTAPPLRPLGISIVRYLDRDEINVSNRDLTHEVWMNSRMSMTNIQTFSIL